MALKTDDGRNNGGSSIPGETRGYRLGRILGKDASPEGLAVRLRGCYAAEGGLGPEGRGLLEYLKEHWPAAEEYLVREMLSWSAAAEDRKTFRELIDAFPEGTGIMLRQRWAPRGGKPGGAFVTENAEFLDEILNRIGLSDRPEKRKYWYGSGQNCFRTMLPEKYAAVLAGDAGMTAFLLDRGAFDLPRELILPARSRSAEPWSVDFPGKLSRSAGMTCGGRVSCPDLMTAAMLSRSVENYEKIAAMCPPNAPPVSAEGFLRAVPEIKKQYAARFPTAISPEQMLRDAFHYADPSLLEMYLEDCDREKRPRYALAEGVLRWEKRRARAAGEKSGTLESFLRLRYYALRREDNYRCGREAETFRRALEALEEPRLRRLLLLELMAVREWVGLSEHKSEEEKMESDHAITAVLLPHLDEIPSLSGLAAIMAPEAFMKMVIRLRLDSLAAGRKCRFRADHRLLKDVRKIHGNWLNAYMDAVEPEKVRPEADPFLREVICRGDGKLAAERGYLTAVNAPALLAWVRSQGKRIPPGNLIELMRIAQLSAKRHSL